MAGAEPGARRRRRFGECLAGIVPLSGHDVSEILETQGARGRLFGEIALSWGLCTPQDVWQAWLTQMGPSEPVPGDHVNLRALGIDAQAATMLPRDLAIRYRAVAARRVGEELIVAADPRSAGRAAAELPALLKKNVRVVIADTKSVADGLRKFYAADGATQTACDGTLPGRTVDDACAA